MIILIMGASHTGKTLLSQKLMERYKIPYLSIDHLKMGLIRSGNTDLTPYDDEQLTNYLWNIVKEIIKTAIENSQSLIIEGCYFPYTWQNDLEPSYLCHVHHVCLVMTRSYIEGNFSSIKEHACVIENRLSDDIDKNQLIEDNEILLEQCKKNGINYILIDKAYNVDFYV